MTTGLAERRIGRDQITKNGRPRFVADVLQVRNLLKSHSLVAVAREYGVHRNTLSRFIQSDPVARECIARQPRPRYPPDILRQLREASEFKECSNCDESKPLGAFPYRPACGTYRNQCKACTQQWWNTVQQRHRALRVKPRSKRLCPRVFKHDALKDALSLDAPMGRGRHERTLLGKVPDPTPSVLDRIVQAEGAFRVAQRLSDEKKIPLAQAEAIVKALVNSDLLEEGKVCDLADMLRQSWEVNRPAARDEKVHVRFQRPLNQNPEFAEYDHWRRKYGLARTGRVITRTTEPASFGSAWSVETAAPEDLREEQV